MEDVSFEQVGGVKRFKQHIEHMFLTLYQTNGRIWCYCVYHPSGSHPGQFRKDIVIIIMLSKLSRQVLGKLYCLGISILSDHLYPHKFFNT